MFLFWIMLSFINPDVCIDISEDDWISDEAWSLTHVVMIIVDVFDASPSSFSSILGSNPTIATDLVSYLWCFPCSKYDYSDDKLCWSQVVHSLFWNQWPSRDGYYIYHQTGPRRDHLPLQDGLHAHAQARGREGLRQEHRGRVRERRRTEGARVDDLLRDQGDPTEGSRDHHVYRTMQSGEKAGDVRPHDDKHPVSGGDGLRHRHHPGHGDGQRGGSQHGLSRHLPLLPGVFQASSQQDPRKEASKEGCHDERSLTAARTVMTLLKTIEGQTRQYHSHVRLIVVYVFNASPSSNQFHLGLVSH